MHTYYERCLSYNMEESLTLQQEFGECEICLETDVQLYGITGGTCTHSFCLMCCTDHIVAGVREFKDIKCPKMGCEAKLNE